MKNVEKKESKINYRYNSVADIDKRIEDIKNGDNKFSMNGIFSKVDSGLLKEVLKDNNMFINCLLDLDEIDRRFYKEKVLIDLKKTIFDIIDIAKNFEESALKQTVLVLYDIVFYDFPIDEEKIGEEIDKLNTVLKNTLNILKTNKSDFFLDYVFNYPYEKKLLLNESYLLDILKDALIKEENVKRKAFLREKYINNQR